MGSFLTDVGLSLRLFLRSPGFTLAAVAALALGIGTNTAIFSVVNAVMLKPLHAPDPSRVVSFSVDDVGSRSAASDIKFNLWLEQTGAFEQQSAFRSSSLDLVGVDHPQKLNTVSVTADYFRLFGLSIAQGRGFSAEEERPGGRHVVLLSDGFWKRALGADPHIIGKTISLGGDSFEVIGLMARDAQIETGEPPDVFLPFPIDPNSTSQIHYFRAAGRLKSGVTLETANAQLLIATQEFRRRYPQSISTRRGDILRVEPMQEVLVKDIRLSLLTMWAAVCLVLLIACANVANLLLVKATVRRREIAIRSALGASRARVVRQLLTESGVLAAMGAALGLALGISGMRGLLALNAVNLPRIGVNGANIGIDWRVLVFTLSVTLLTGFLFGLIPALQASRTDVNSSLKESAGRTGTGFHQGRTRACLVVGEMSLALLLLIGAGLLIRTLVALRSVNPGFDPANVVATEVTLDPKLSKASTLDQVVQDVVRRVSSLPGVESAALSNLLPLNGDFNSLPVIVIGRPLDGAAHGFVRWTIVSPHYFGTLKIPLVRGRLFTDADRRGAPLVAVINQSMAKKVWPNGTPIGEQIFIAKGLGEDFDEPSRQIVGIVGDVHDDALNRDSAPAIFIPAEQRPGPPARGRSMWMLMKIRTSSPSLNAAMQNELRQASGGLAVPPVRSMDQTLAKSTARQLFNMVLMTIFGASALLLAAIGVYGLMAYSVQQRTQEIGIRLALGSERATVRGMIMRQGTRLILAGVAIGVTGALVFSRVIETFLFGVQARDALVFVTVPIVLGGVALFAVWLPALRASRVDPTQALRYE